MSREKIIREAARLFAFRGVRAISMLDVAMQCRNKPGELKLHFATKRSLVAAIIDDFIQHHERHLRCNPRLSPDVHYEIRNFFQLIEQAVETFNPVFLWEIKKYYKPQRRKMTAFKEQRMIPYLNDVIRRGVQQGYYVLANDHLYAEVYFITLNEIITCPLPVNIIDAVQAMNTMFYNGIVRTGIVCSAGTFIPAIRNGE
jgi:AcrR family transcriptional regulator